MNKTVRILPNKGFDYINTGNPSTTTNPPVALVTWLNATTGVLFICTDNTTNANVWVMIGGSFRGASVKKPTSTNQTITTATDTDIVFGEAIEDTDSFWSSGVNPERLTVPTGVTRVRLSASIRWDGNATGWRGLQIRKNGGRQVGLPFDKRDLNSTINNTIVVASAAVPCVAGDYFTVNVHQTSGGNLDVSTAVPDNWFTIEVVE
jgi:hypothetical protein